MGTASSLYRPEPPLGRGVRLYAAAARMLDSLQSICVLALRLYVARVFFTSGWIKIGNWSGTLGLFQNEFHVPLLPPHIAAMLGTANDRVADLPHARARHAPRRCAFRLQHRRRDLYPGLDAGLQDHILWGTCSSSSSSTDWQIAITSG
jgi:putative oxidoreductase